MKTVILYYTFGGATKKEAENLGTKLGVPTYRVKETRNRCMLASFIPGALWARQRKSVAIQPLPINLHEYDRIIIGCPVWGGYPAPAFNAIVALLPAGKEVEVYLCSAGGETPDSAQGTKELIAKKGSTVVGYRDIRTGATPNKMKE